MRLTRGGTEEADVERVLGGCRFYEWGPPNADHPEQESDGTAKRSGEARGPESTRSFPPILARIKRPGRVGGDYHAGTATLDRGDLGGSDTAPCEKRRAATSAFRRRKGR